MPSHRLLNKSYYVQRERTQEPQTIDPALNGALKKPLISPGILRREKHTNLAPTNPQGQSAAGQPWGGAGGKQAAHPMGGYLLKGFGLKPINEKNRAWILD